MGVAAGVASGVVAGVVAGVAPVSDGSPPVVAAGVLVVPAGGVLLSQAPRTVARLNIRAKPKIFVFITPLSPNKGNRNLAPVQ